jgi:hypothetical protein
MNAIWMLCFTLASLEKQGSFPKPASEPPAFRLMAPQRESNYRQLLPKVDDPHIQQVLDDPSLLLYTENEMPRAYQFWDGAFPGIHSATYNISANGSEPFGNGNREFPWGAPAGTHRAANVRSFRFLWLPKDDKGQPLPIVWYRKRFQTNGSSGYAWTYPVGTVFGEVLMMRAPDGYDYTFELRVRTREVGDWAVDVFRPFPTAEDLVARVKQLRPRWHDEPKVRALVEHLSKPLPGRLYTIADRQPRRRVFRQAMAIDVLPPLDDDNLVATLLTKTPFRSAHSTAWRVAPGGAATAAPTTTARFHIVPANYDAGFVEVDRHSCRRCHETVNQDVDQFDAGRDWYGRIRGSDGIFSFHPFAPESISGNGYSVSVRMRKELEQAGLLARFDPKKHPHPLYGTIPHLVE